MFKISLKNITEQITILKASIILTEYTQQVADIFFNEKFFKYNDIEIIFVILKPYQLAWFLNNAFFDILIVFSYVFLIVIKYQLYI